MGDLGFEPRFEGLKVLCNYLYTNRPLINGGGRIRTYNLTIMSRSLHP